MVRRFLYFAAVSLLLQFSHFGSAEAGFDEGLAAAKGGDYAAALREWLPLAEQGYANAQYSLGVMYYKGQGVPQDYTEAAKWFRKAAEQGYADAKYNLGLLYYKGKGVPRDFTEARKWFRKAAEQGHAEAQYNLGIMYAHGQGVPQDHLVAVKWYRKAAERGYANAQSNLGIMYAHGQGVPQDYSEALKWYRRAAKQGYSGAQHNLGLMYAKGWGVPQDKSEAAKWYRKAAEQGNVSAQAMLGVLYFHGEGVPKDKAKSAKWYRKAAEQGDAISQSALGLMYYEGSGVPRDYVQAHMWVNLAVAQSRTSKIRNFVVKNRDIVAKKLSLPQVAKARRLAREWMENHSKKRVVAFDCSNLEWSSEPGAYETHLKRRCNNPYFPASRRTVSKKELEAARRIDGDDLISAVQRFAQLIKEIRSFPPNQTFGDLNKFRIRLEYLIKFAMGMGDQGYQISYKVDRLREGLIEDMRAASSNDASSLAAIRAGVTAYKRYQRKFQIPVLAQMLRERSPILVDDTLATVLSSDPKSIAIFMSLLPKDEQALTRVMALKMMKEALKSGYEDNRMEEKIHALNGKKGSE